MSLIIERSHHCSACLLTTSTRCQNRSAPFSDLSLQIYCNDIEYAKNLTLFNPADAFLDELCDDMHISKADLVAKLGSVGFEYNPQQNKFW